MKKRTKKIIIIVVAVILILGILMFFMMQMMKQKTEEALDKQVNETIDMTKVKDGIYTGSSDGGMVQVVVEVEVKDHEIKNIKLVKHDNGKGKPAEVMIDEMIKENTDDVDIVSGATASSRTIRNAVNVALQQGIEQ